MSIFSTQNLVFSSIVDELHKPVALTLDDMEIAHDEARIKDETTADSQRSALLILCNRVNLSIGIS